jgi:hypothetical protein
MKFSPCIFLFKLLRLPVYLSAPGRRQADLQQAGHFVPRNDFVFIIYSATADYYLLFTFYSAAADYSSVPQVHMKFLSP